MINYAAEKNIIRRNAFMNFAIVRGKLDGT